MRGDTIAGKGPLAGATAPARGMAVRACITSERPGRVLRGPAYRSESPARQEQAHQDSGVRAGVGELAR